MEIFKLIGSVFVDSAEADASLQKTDKNAQGVGTTLLSGVKTAAKWGTAIVGAAATAAAGVVALATSSASTCDEIDKMSQKLGISREAYQELDYVLSQNGMDVDTLQSGMKTLVNQMSAAQEGTKSATDAFGALGVSVTNSDGSLRSQEDVFYDTISALQGVSNETERNALANDLFGKSASELAPLLNSGAGSMEELRQKAHDLGIVLNDDVIDSGVSLTDTIDTMKRSFSSVVTQLGGAVMPIVETVVNFIIDNMPLIQSMIEQLAPVFTSLLENMLPPLMDLASSLLPVICTFIQTLIPIISEIAAAILPLFTTLLEQLLPPLLEIAQAILPIVTSLISALLPVLEPLLELISPILELVLALITPLLDLIAAILPAITDIITKFIIPALELLVEGVQAVATWFVKAWADIKGAWSVVADFFAGIWDSISASASIMVTSIVEFFSGAWDTIKATYNSVADFFTGVFTDAWNGIKNAFSEVTDFFSGVFQTIKDLFKTPHFTFSGSLNPLEWDTKGTPKISVAWYKKGGIMMDPTIFGYDSATNTALAGGEAGPEAIVPIDTLRKYIADATQNDKQTVLLEAILFLLQKLDAGLYETIVDALVNGVRFDVDNREIGRLVKTYA